MAASTTGLGLGTAAFLAVGVWLTFLAVAVRDEWRFRRRPTRRPGIVKR